MKVHVYSIVRNDAYILPYLLRHYSLFADKIFIFDDHSTDNTVEIAKAYPKVEVSTFPYERGMNEEDFSHCHGTTYKKHSRGIADWVMCVDSDEFVYHKFILNVLKEETDKGTKLIKPTGYMMVSENLPEKDGQIYDECKKGIRFPRYDKPVIFDPSIDIEFGMGRHTCKLQPRTNTTKGRLLFLHYRYLSKDYFVERSLHLYDRSKMDTKTRKYRMKRGLAWYDKYLNSPELVDII